MPTCEKCGKQFEGDEWKTKCGACFKKMPLETDKQERAEKVLRWAVQYVGRLMAEELAEPFNKDAGIFSTLVGSAIIEMRKR